MKKLLVSLFIGLTVFLSFAPYLSPAKAQATWYNQSFQEWYGKVYDPTNPSEIFGERYTAAQVQWIIYGLWSFLINTATGPQNAGIIQCFISNVADISTCMTQLSGLLTTSAQNPTVAAANIPAKQNLWGLVFASDRPLSGISYAREKLQKLSLVPVAHARTVGFGFNKLEVIQDMWKAFRDIAFGLFVIVAVVFAFMIMFRVKLSPQTVISVQSALPKIIVALILVTFSYAIAGLLIDLMYVVIGLISVVLLPITGHTAIWNFNFLTVGQPWGGLQLGVFVAGLVYIVLFILFFIVLAAMTLSGLLAIVGATVLIALVGSTGIGLLVLILLAIVAVVVLVLMFIKTIWALLKAFVNILLLTIFAPIQIALGVLIPNLGFGQWLKSFVSNLAVFVVTGALMLFSFIFLFQGISIGLGDAVQDILSVIGFLPGAIYQAAVSSSPWPPLLGGGDSAPATGLLFLGVSFVLFTLIPKATEITKGFISGKPFAYGTAIGEAFGPFAGPAKLAQQGAISFGAERLIGGVGGTGGLKGLAAGLPEGQAKKIIAGLLENIRKAATHERG